MLSYGVISVENLRYFIYDDVINRGIENPEKYEYYVVIFDVGNNKLKIARDLYDFENIHIKGGFEDYEETGLSINEYCSHFLTMHQVYDINDKEKTATICYRMELKE
jgi:hypothetical protein